MTWVVQVDPVKILLVGQHFLFRSIYPHQVRYYLGKN